MLVKNHIRYSVLSLGIALSLLFSGCGAPPPPPPTAPVQAPLLLGNYLEDPSPGSQHWDQLQNRAAANQALSQNFFGNAVANIQKKTLVDYTLDCSNQTNPLKRTAENPGSQQVSPSYQMEANPNGVVTLVSPNGPSQSFQFAPSVEIGGLILYSTELVALFVSSDRQAILKANYSVGGSPPVQLFTFLPPQNYGGAYGWSPYTTGSCCGCGSTQNITVEKKDISVNYTYRPYQGR